MIDPKELRIGNWTLDHKGDLYQIENPVLDYPTVHPIPLTPEWLVYHLKYEHALTIENGKMYLSNEEGAPESIEIKYVHQLQNLFFALTGEEL